MLTRSSGFLPRCLAAVLSSSHSQRLVPAATYSEQFLARRSGQHRRSQTRFPGLRVPCVYRHRVLSPLLFPFVSPRLPRKRVVARPSSCDGLSAICFCRAPLPGATLTRIALKDIPIRSGRGSTNCSQIVANHSARLGATIFQISRWPKS